MKALHIFFFSLLFLAFACKDSGNDMVRPAPQPVALKLLGTTYITGAATKAKVYAEAALSTGYNRIYVALYDSAGGQAVQDAHVYFKPLVQMGSAGHAVPAENPEGAKPVNGYYQGAVLFTTASSGSATWQLGIHVHNHSNSKEGSGQLPVMVQNPALSRMHTFAALNDSSNIYIGPVDLLKPQVGINDIQFVLFRLAADSFTPVTNYSISINPTMPSMGHGSPNNVNPVHTQSGHYKGKVNFTMGGLWRVNLLLKEGIAVADSTTYFEFTPGN